MIKHPTLLLFIGLAWGQLKVKSRIGFNEQTDHQ